MPFVIMIVIALGIVFFGLGAFLYFDLSRRLGEIESADDAPHALVRQVEESRIENHDNRDEIRRHGQRIDALEGQKITMIARVGEQGKLYGSITSVHIAEEVTKLIGGDEAFDHRKVLLPEAIKEVGIQPIGLRLTRNVEATIEVEVLAEGEDLDEAEAGEQPTAEGPEGPQAEVEEEAAEAEETAEEPPAPDTTEPEAETEEEEEPA